MSDLKEWLLATVQLHRLEGGRPTGLPAPVAASLHSRSLAQVVDSSDGQYSFTRKRSLS